MEYKELETYVQHKHFKVGKMLVIKQLQNTSWWGLRYLAGNNVLVYGEYHVNELEPWAKPKEITNTIDITDTNPQ